MRGARAKIIAERILNIMMTSNERLSSKEISEKYIKQFPDEKDTNKRLPEVLSIIKGADILTSDERNSNYYIVQIHYKKEILLNKLNQLILLKLLIERNRKDLNDKKLNNEHDIIRFYEEKRIKLPFIVFCLKTDSDAKVIYSISHPNVEIQGKKNPLISTLSPFDIIKTMKFTDQEKQAAINSIKILPKNSKLYNLILKELK